MHDINTCRWAFILGELVCGNWPLDSYVDLIISKIYLNILGAMDIYIRSFLISFTLACLVSKEIKFRYCRLEAVVAED